MGEPKTEHPILFSAPMVRAILAGQKTQTRRVVGLDTLRESTTPGYDLTWRGQAPVRSIAQQRKRPGGCWQDMERERFLGLCPHGAVGHALWVKETHAIEDARDLGLGASHVIFRATATDDEIALVKRWRPSIFMSRWASRLTLAVLSVRVERLQSITEEDAIAEGMAHRDAGADRYGQPLPGWSWRDPHPVDTEPSFGWEHCLGTARHAFGNLWNEINGKRPGCSWGADPYVWVVGFGPAEVRS